MRGRGLLAAGMLLAVLASAPQQSSAGERHVTGAAIGAGLGAIIAGPPGAIVGVDLERYKTLCRTLRTEQDGY